MTTRLNERILIVHTATRLTLEVTAEKKLHCAVNEENDTFSPYVALDDISTFEVVRMDTLAPLADRQDNDLDPQVSVQLEQAKERAVFCFGKEKGKSKDKSKILLRPTCSPLENRRQRLKELRAKTECDVHGRKGHWAYDRDRAMSPSGDVTDANARIGIAEPLRMSAVVRRHHTCIVTFSTCAPVSCVTVSLHSRTLPP